jgi:hypothetical protein
MQQAQRQKTLKAVLHYFYQDNTRSGSHCRYSLQYHLVWIPKYRRSFLVGEIAERLKQILNPQYAFAYGHRGNTYLDKGDYDRAIVEF